MKEDKVKTNDYIACVYPIGVTSMNKLVAFKHSDIDKIVLKGLTDKEYTKLVELMNKKNA